MISAINTAEQVRELTADEIAVVSGGEAHSIDLKVAGMHIGIDWFDNGNWSVSVFYPGGVIQRTGKV